MSCGHIDYPCCGCGPDPTPEQVREMDEADAEELYQTFPDDGDEEGVDWEEGQAGVFDQYGESELARRNFDAEAEARQDRMDLGDTPLGELYDGE